LQILRIIQEESLKDNTASVLCQVPVDVASFLLNEKRTEIAKIELKQRINVLLVPNKTLETPNYKLERLKHDDPRLDNIEASYKMADEVEDPTASRAARRSPPTSRRPSSRACCRTHRHPVAAAQPAPAPVVATPVRAAVPGDTRQSQLGFAEGDNHQRDGALEQAITDEGVQAPSPRTENGEPREKRNRDRYGRERGPRGDRSENEERPDLRIPVQPAKVTNDEVAAETTEQASTTAPVTERAPVAALSVVPTKASPVTVTAAPLARMPSVTPFSLPTDALQAVAVSSGLQWVNSDETKVAAVQAAIAAEPKAIHVPRERTELLQIETGPLVLVETRRDLRNMTLPFEQPPSA
jgi:hypothetical protein